MRFVSVCVCDGVCALCECVMVCVCVCALCECDGVRVCSNVRVLP